MSTPLQDRILDVALRIIDPTIRITPAPAQPAAPAVECTELWARNSSIAVIKIDQLDNETSVIDSTTLRKLLAKAGYEFISAHQKEDK